MSGQVEIETVYHIRLEEEAAIALKKLLGHQTDGEYADAGIYGDSRALMRDLWGLLPDDAE